MIRPLLETDSNLDVSPFDAAPVSTSPLAMSRRTLLAAGALAAVAIALPALPARADFVYGDLKAIRYLEEIAHLEADYFQKAAMSAPADAFIERESNVINLIAREDAEVSRWFGAARDKYGVSAFDGPTTRNQASSRPIPSYRFPLEAFNTRDSLLAQAIDIKTLAVGAFHSAVGAAKDPKLVEAFAALGGVQGRHLAMLSEIAGQTPFTAFEATQSREEVATKLALYGFNMEVAG